MMRMSGVLLWKGEREERMREKGEGRREKGEGAI